MAEPAASTPPETVSETEAAEPEQDQLGDERDVAVPGTVAAEPDHKSLLHELAGHIRTVAASGKKDVTELLAWLASQGPVIPRHDEGRHTWPVTGIRRSSGCSRSRRRETDRFSSYWALLEQSAANEKLTLRKLDKIYGLLAAPARMFLTIEGDSEMPLTVDSTNAVAILSFEDDHGDAVAPPSGALATATSDNTAVLTVGAAVAGADANGIANIQFPLTEVAEGTSYAVRRRDRREREPAARAGRGHPDSRPGAGHRDGQPGRPGSRGVHGPRQLTAPLSPSTPFRAAPSLVFGLATGRFLLFAAGDGGESLSCQSQRRAADPRPASR